MTVRPIRGGPRAYVPSGEVVEDLEREVLEAILADPAALPRVDAIVSPLDFLSPRLRHVFSAMLRVEAITIPLLADELGA